MEKHYIIDTANPTSIIATTWLHDNQSKDNALIADLPGVRFGEYKQYKSNRGKSLDILTTSEAYNRFGLYSSY